MKFLHQILHSLINYFVTKIAYMYFSSSNDLTTQVKYNSSAQLMALSMIANKEIKGEFTKMYNDEIMVLYLVMALYFSMRNKPLVASFWVTMGLGVKAGVILILPGFLGSIQYNHGTIALIKSLVLIVGF